MQQNLINARIKSSKCFKNNIDWIINNIICKYGYKIMGYEKFHNENKAMWYLQIDNKIWIDIVLFWENGVRM